MMGFLGLGIFLELGFFGYKSDWKASTFLLFFKQVNFPCLYP